MNRAIGIIILVFTSPFQMAEVQANNHVAVPRLDRSFLRAPELRQQMLSSIMEVVQPACEARISQANINARETCALPSIVSDLEASEKELSIRNGAPLITVLSNHEANENSVWRYFIRIRKAHRVLKSVKDYLSNHAEARGTYVLGQAIPLLAATLDNYSHWSRWLIMYELQECPTHEPEVQLFTPPFCHELENQLNILARNAVHNENLQVSLPNSTQFDQYKSLILLAQSIQKRVSDFTLDELNSLESMTNVTSAGLGIPFFRQLVSRLQISDFGSSPKEQLQIQKFLILEEIVSALESLPSPTRYLTIDTEAVSALNLELRFLINHE